MRRLLAILLALCATADAEFFRNTTGQGVYLYAYNETDGTPKTGDAANITPYISKDGAAEGALTDTTPAEIDATNCPGVYWVDLTQGETDCAQFVVTATSTTADIGIEPVFVVTSTVSASVATVDGNVDAILTDTAAMDSSTELRILLTGSDTALSTLTAAQVNAEADTALADYDAPTAAELTAELGALETHGDSAWATATGFSTLDAAGVRTALGMSSANLDTQIADLPTVAEFEARTLAAASYFDPATDAVANVTTVGTLTGHTPQTGDSYARLGAPAGLTVSADVAAVKAETASILEDTGTTIPGLIAALENLSEAEVLTQVNAALVALHLDHLLAVTYDPASKPGAADALMNEIVESDAGVARFTANALEQSPSASGGDATEAKQDAILASLDAAKGATFDTATDSLEAIRDRGDAAWLSGAGEGAITYTYTLTLPDLVTPIDDALVEVYTEAAMVNKVAQGRTDAFGVVTFYLDAGTYYLKRSKSLYSFTNPQTVTVAP